MRILSNDIAICFTVCKSIKRQTSHQLKTVVAYPCVQSSAVASGNFLHSDRELYLRELHLLFDFKAYAIPLVFSLFVVLALMVMMAHFLGRVNILEIISEAHRAEPIHAVPRWFGIGGIALVILGGLLGYYVPIFCVQQMHWYPPEGLTSVFYLPALVGLYMLLLHTVVNGWKKGKSRYPQLIATGMMQFQGQQTVRNMLVITVLVAGAYFAAFYSPMMATGSQLNIEGRTEDYAFFYPINVNMPDQAEIEELAAQNAVTVQDYRRQSSAQLAVDGELHVETESSIGTTYTMEYQPRLESGRFFSESAWNALTGDNLDLAPGTVAGVFNSEGYGNQRCLRPGNRGTVSRTRRRILCRSSKCRKI